MTISSLIATLATVIKVGMRTAVLMTFACILCAMIMPGVSAPATDSSAETPTNLHLPPGFEIRLFASEPLVVNPRAMTWDHRGRLWVIERDLPPRAPLDPRSAHRVSILGDTDNDGRADTATVFAHGFSNATALALGNDGVYLGAGSKLHFLTDTNSDNKIDLSATWDANPDNQGSVLLHSFAWGPDGCLYMTRRITRTRGAEADGTDIADAAGDGGLVRFHPRTKRFEVFADVTGNPCSVDWNERGDAFVSVSAARPLFHTAPAGQYQRSSGGWANPYGYAKELPGGGLPPVSAGGHGGSNYAGLVIYQGDQWPTAWRGLAFFGNLQRGVINCELLVPVGSTYHAERESRLLGPPEEALGSSNLSAISTGREKRIGAGNFLVSETTSFRPSSLQIGPDGALWVMDTPAACPCHNAGSTAGADATPRGRIWRVVWVGEQKGKAVASRPTRQFDLSQLSTLDLADLLEHENVWHRRMAQRLLSGRVDLRAGTGIHGSSKVHKLVESGNDIRFRLAALWALHGANELEDDFLRVLDKDKDPALRAWVARLTGERGFPFGAALNRLARLAQDTNASVRLAAAGAARQFVSGDLTVNTPLAYSQREVITGGILSDLQKSPIVDGDPVLPFVYWMALEPVIAADAGGALGFMENSKDSDLAKWA